jgi:hypothetical protein
MPEICTFGLMSGNGKRSVAAWPYRAHPRLYLTRGAEHLQKGGKKLGLSFTDHVPEQTSEFLANGLPVAQWLEHPPDGLSAVRYSLAACLGGVT